MKLFEKIKKNIDIYLIREFCIFGRSVFLCVKNTLNGEKRNYIFGRKVDNFSYLERTETDKKIEKKKDSINDEAYLKISVIVNFNKKKNLCENTSLSLLKQTYRNFEVIFVGNLYKDNVIKIADRITVHNESTVEEGVKNQLGNILHFAIMVIIGQKIILRKK